MEVKRINIGWRIEEERMDNHIPFCMLTQRNEMLVSDICL
jgi:hypothetical protein